MIRSVLKADGAQTEFSLLDELSRSRALTEAESLRLEQVIRQLDGKKRERQRRAWSG